MLRVLGGCLCRIRHRPAGAEPCAGLEFLRSQGRARALATEERVYPGDRRERIAGHIRFDVDAINPNANAAQTPTNFMLTANKWQPSASTILNPGFSNQDPVNTHTHMSADDRHFHLG